MAWTHDSGYPPAYRHVGYPASVLTDGTDTGTTAARVEPDVVGWRAACECGWRSAQFYPRAEWPSATGYPPALVEGWDTGTGTYADWSIHLDRALPELAVHDYARELAEVRQRLDAAVRTARRAGVPWSLIGPVAGVTAERAQRRWGAHERGPTAGYRPEPTAGPQARSSQPPKRDER